MNLEFENYKYLLDFAKKTSPITSHTYRWEDITTHDVTKEEMPIIAEAKKIEKRNLCFVVLIAVLFLLISVYGLFFIKEKKFVFLLTFAMDLIVWYFAKCMIFSIFRSQNDKIAYGYTERVFSEYERRGISTPYYKVYYADFCIPTTHKYLKRVHIESSSKAKKLKEGDHVALYSFRLGVPDFVILDENGRPS